MANAKMLTHPIEMVAPSQEMRAFYDSHIERSGKEDLPTSHEVRLHYEDGLGNHYNESSILDLEAMKGTMYTSVKTVHDIGQTLEKIERALRNASLLQRSGFLNVDAATEDRAVRDERVAAEETERRARYERSRGQLQSQQSHGPQGDGSVENEGGEGTPE